MQKQKIKVLVVDDSAFMRKVISDMLNADEDIETIATARNGEDAIKKVEELKPDVVTLDIEMPVMDGITALAIIMKQSPLPVVMLSSLTHEGAQETIKALELGAFDFIGKPSGAISLDIHKIQNDLLLKVKLAAENKRGFNNIRQPVSQEKYKKVEYDKNITKKSSATSQKQKVVLLGTSTGGPRALQAVMSQLPGNIPAAILVVQHMPPGFTKSLADRLDTLSELTITEAIDNTIIENGHAYIAPGGKQMAIVRNNFNKYIIRVYEDAPICSGHKPSVDFLFNSGADMQTDNIVAVVMTGMGADGAKGIKRLKENGAKTIVEHKDSCIVYGMPRVIIEAGHADFVVPLPEIASKIIEVIKH